MCKKHTMTYTFLLIILLQLLLLYKIAEDKEDKYYNTILDYRTEQAIMYTTSSIRDNTGETFWLTTYGLDDSEKEQYTQMYVKIEEIDIMNTSVKDILAIIPEWDPKLYEDFRIELSSNGKGFKIFK